jgi:hypothetical protein
MASRSIEGQWEAKHFSCGYLAEILAFLFIELFVCGHEGPLYCVSPAVKPSKPRLHDNVVNNAYGMTITTPSCLPNPITLPMVEDYANNKTLVFSTRESIWQE